MDKKCKRSKPIKRVTFSKLDEVFDEIEVVDEWAIVYHPNPTKPRRFINEAPSSIQSKISNFKQIANRRKEEASDNRLSVEISRNNSSCVEKVKYTTLSKFYNPITESSQNKHEKKMKPKVHISPTADNITKIAKRRIFHRRNMTKEIDSSCKFANKESNNKDVQKKACEEWRIQRASLATNNCCTFRYLNSIPKSSDEKPKAHESLNYNGESIKTVIKNDNSNSEYLSITSRNLKKLNCKTNRSVSQESLVGAMIKGTSFKLVYPETQVDLNNTQNVDENPLYYNTNVKNLLIPSSKVQFNSSILSPQRKLCCISLLSPTLSLIDGNLHDGNEKIGIKTNNMNICSDKEECNSINHLSTDES